MRIIFFGNNWVGWQTLKWLRKQPDPVVAIILHESARRKYGQQLLDEAGLDETCVFDAGTLETPETLARIDATSPDIGVSAYFGHILKPPVLGLLPRGCVNLHPALLPYNRGAYPNVWSIIDRTPAGATLHWIDPGVDTGDIIAQREIPVEATDTGETLHRKLERLSVDVFKDNWPSVVAGTAPRTRQLAGTGTGHRVRDVRQVDEIDLDKSYLARDLLDILRARTFPPHRGAHFRIGDRKIFVEVKLTYGDEGDSQ